MRYAVSSDLALSARLSRIEERDRGDLAQTIVLDEQFGRPYDTGGRGTKGGAA